LLGLIGMPDLHAFALQIAAAAIGSTISVAAIAGILWWWIA